MEIQLNKPRIAVGACPTLYGMASIRERRYMYMVLTNTKMGNLRIDADDADLDLYRWCRANGGYAVHATYIRGYRNTIRLHRVVLERKLRRALKPTEFADHIDGNPLNNTRSNLRVVSPQENTWNRSAQRQSSSPYLGVYKSNRSGRWAAFQKHDGLRLHIGYFDTEADAAWMRDQWALELHGEFARLNFNYITTGREQ